MKKLSPMDYAFLALESPESPMHVTALQIFEIPKGYRGNFAADLVNEMLERREVGPPLNYKLKPALIGLPSWEELEYVDLEYHVRHSALPKPGTMRELWHLVSRLTSRLLDRHRPMWELHVIEGLEGNRFALYIKMHHAFIDGATGVRMMQAMLSESPEDTEVRGLWEPRETTKRPRRPPASPLAQLVKTVQGVQGQLKTVPELAGLVLRRGLQLSGVRPGYLAAPFTAPRTPFNAPLGVARRNAGVSLPLARMKAVGKSVGATLNEVLLTTVDSAFNRYLRERGVLPDRPLVAETAMDLRKPGVESKGGNVVAILFVNLGQPDADPISRLRQVHKSSKATKEEAQNISPGAMMSFSLIPQFAAQVADKLGIAQELPPIANILVSNVKGLSKPYYLKGAQLQTTFTAPPIAPGMAMTIITCSYMDSIDVGMSSDRDAVPGLEQLAEYIGEAFEELEAAASAKQAGASKSSEPKKTAASKPSEPAKAAGSTTKAEPAAAAEAAK
jgi:diacylglycerol O-acyltransferase